MLAQQEGSHRSGARLPDLTAACWVQRPHQTQPPQHSCSVLPAGVGRGGGCLAALQSHLFPVACLAGWRSPAPHDLLAMIWSTSGFCSFAKKRAWMK